MSCWPRPLTHPQPRARRSSCRCKKAWHRSISSKQTTFDCGTRQCSLTRSNASIRLPVDMSHKGCSRDPHFVRTTSARRLRHPHKRCDLHSGGGARRWSDLARQCERRVRPRDRGPSSPGPSILSDVALTGADARPDGGSTLTIQLDSGVLESVLPLLGASDVFVFKAV